MPINRLTGLASIAFWLVIRLGVGQTALKMPETLTKAEKRLNINCLLAKSGTQLSREWVVFSDRERGYDNFGERLYVVEERETELHVYKASGCKDRKLIAGVDKGWKRKSDLLVSFGADFTENSLIHKKCVILNHHRTIERIKQGEISESEVPVYSSPSDITPIDNAPLYLIYFVYKSENNRYLLGKDYRFDPDLPFVEQIIGWVDRDRVFDYNNRICFEPSFEEGAVAWRRCNPGYAAKVFELEGELTRFLKGDTSVKPIWVEPDYYFFRNPKYTAGKPGSSETFELNEKTYAASYLKKLCLMDGDVPGIKKSGILTGRPLPGNKFRFPLIRKDDLPENVFMTGVTGRFENEQKSRANLCESLKSHKSQVSVCFVLDNSIDRNRLAYVIGQIRQEYTELHMKFGVCFYPRLRIGQFNIPAGTEVSSKDDNYRRVRDFILNYESDARYEIPHDNVLKTLNYVIGNESFDSRQTNIIVLVNNRSLSVPDAGLAELRRSVQTGMVEKNCYLLAFDYRNDNNLVQQIQEISTAAAREYAGRLDISSGNVMFRQTDLGYEMENAALLSIIEQADTLQLAAVQMQGFLQTGYRKIQSTINSAIGSICQNGPRGTAVRSPTEDPFQKALKDIPGMEGQVEYIRALEEGYSSIRYELPDGGYTGNIWKTNVMMTKPELETLGSLLDKMVVHTNNATFSRSVYDLWIALFNRFVGDNLSPGQLLPLTPQMIMNRILGETYGYSLTDPLKRYPLERILSNDQEVQRLFPAYMQRLISCNASIREILASGRQRFSLADDAVRANQVSMKKAIYYYWVPIDILP